VIAVANAPRQSLDQVICQDKPAEFRRQSIFRYRHHAIPSEGDHLQGATLSQLLWKDCEAAIGEERNLQVMQTAEIVREFGEGIVGQVEHLQGIGEIEDFEGEVEEATGLQAETFCAVVVTSS
jgi:hypothetical protein